MLEPLYNSWMESVVFIISIVVRLSDSNTYLFIRMIQHSDSRECVVTILFKFNAEDATTNWDDDCAKETIDIKLYKRYVRFWNLKHGRIVLSICYDLKPTMNIKAQCLSQR